MTKEEHNLLVENNKLLKCIIQILTNNEANNLPINILANIMADRLMCK